MSAFACLAGGYAALVTITFTILRLAGVLRWNWEFVTAPLWLFALLMIARHIAHAMMPIEPEKRGERWTS